MNLKKVFYVFFFITFSLPIYGNTESWQQRAKNRAKTLAKEIKNNPKVVAALMATALASGIIGGLLHTLYTRNHTSSKHILLPKKDYTDCFKLFGQIVLCDHSESDEQKLKEYIEQKFPETVGQPYPDEIFFIEVLWETVNNPNCLFREKLINEYPTFDQTILTDEAQFIEKFKAACIPSDFFTKQLNGEQQKLFCYIYCKKLCEITKGNSSAFMSYENFNKTRELFLQAMPLINEEEKSDLINIFITSPYTLFRDSHKYHRKYEETETALINRLEYLVGSAYDKVRQYNEN